MVFHSCWGDSILVEHISAFVLDELGSSFVLYAQTEMCGCSLDVETTVLPLLSLTLPSSCSVWHTGWFCDVTWLSEYSLVIGTSSVDYEVAIIVVSVAMPYVLTHYSFLCYVRKHCNVHEESIYIHMKLLQLILPHHELILIYNVDMWNSHQLLWELWRNLAESLLQYLSPCEWIYQA